jgi:hypothetical protein
MARKKTDPDVAALKRAVNALLSSSSEIAVRAAANYIYNTFVAHPDKSMKEYWRQREAAQQAEPAARPAQGQKEG